MTDADQAQIANIVRAVLIQTLHPSVLRPLPPAPVAANDFHQPEPPQDAA